MRFKERRYLGLANGDINSDERHKQQRGPTQTDMKVLLVTLCLPSGGAGSPSYNLMVLVKLKADANRSSIKIYT